MFDAGFLELLVILTLGLLVLGPDRLPRVVRQVGRWVAQARGAMTKFQREIERELALEEIREQQKKLEQSAAEFANTTIGAADARPAPAHGGDKDAVHGPDAKPAAAVASLGAVDTTVDATVEVTAGSEAEPAAAVAEPTAEAMAANTIVDPTVAAAATAAEDVIENAATAALSDSAFGSKADNA